MKKVNDKKAREHRKKFNIPAEKGVYHPRDKKPAESTQEHHPIKFGKKYKPTFTDLQKKKTIIKEKPHQRALRVRDEKVKARAPIYNELVEKHRRISKGTVLTENQRERLRELSFKIDNIPRVQLKASSRVFVYKMKMAEIQKIERALNNLDLANSQLIKPPETPATLGLPLEQQINFNSTVSESYNVTQSQLKKSGFRFEKPIEDELNRPIKIKPYGFKYLVSNKVSLKSFINIRYENLQNTSLFRYFVAIRFYLDEYLKQNAQRPASVRFFYITQEEEEQFKAVFNLTADRIKTLLTLRTNRELNAWINELHDTNQEGSDVVSDIQFIIPTAFSLFVSNIREVIKGGARRVVSREVGKSIKYSMYEDPVTMLCIEPKSDNDNCLLAVFKFFNPKVKKQFRSVRKDLRLPEGQLPITDVSKVAAYYGVEYTLINERMYDLEKKVGYTIEQLDQMIKENKNIIVCKMDEKLENGHYNILASVEKPKEPKKKIKEEKPDPVKRYITFDYETVHKENFRLIPYSVAVIVDNGEKRLFYGETCNRDFVRYLCTLHDELYDNILIGFNNSRFDNFLLLEQLVKEDLIHQNKILISKGSILGLRFLSFRVFDLCRYTPGMSLKVACGPKGYNCKNQKIDYCHNKIQKLYFEKGMQGLVDFIESSKELEVYNYNDVYCTKELFDTINEQLGKINLEFTENNYTYGKYTKNEDIDEKTIRKNAKKVIEKRSEPPRTWAVDIDNFVTRSSYANMMFMSTNDKPIHLPLNLKMGKRIKKACIGGRAECNIFGAHGDGIESFDAVSLYPYVMKVCPFPIGQAIPINKIRAEQELKNINTFWMMKLRIINPQDKSNILPRKSKDPLDWKYKGEITSWFCNIDIKTLLEYGGQVLEIVGDEHYIWAEGADVFSGFIKCFEKIKCEEYAKGKNMNQARASLVKGSMNDASGKQGQNIITTINYLCTSKNTIQSAFEKINGAVSITDIPGTNSYIIEGCVAEQKITKPWQLAMYIYAWSRRHMYKALIGKFNQEMVWYQTDTDSVHFKKINLPKLLDEKKGFGKFTIGPEFGQFSGELAEKNIVAHRSYHIMPKCYGYFGVGEKIRIKGITDNDKRVYLDCDLKTFRKRFDKLTAEAKLDLFLNGPKAKNEQMFIDLVEGKKIYVLSSRLTRNYKTQSLHQAYVIKTIKVSGLEYF